MAPPPTRRDGPPYGDWRDHVPETSGVDRPNPDQTDVVGARIVAQLVDLVIQFVQLLVVTILLLALLQPQTRSGGATMAVFAMFSLPFYGGVLESRWRGQTVGKRLAGIAVVDARGERPSFGTALLRNLPAVIVFSWVAIAVALASIATTDHRQRLFDMAVGTYVVRR